MVGKCQLGNMRGRTEGRQQTQNEDRIRGVPEAADVKFRARKGCTVWGCSGSPGTATAAQAAWLITGEVSVLRRQQLWRFVCHRAGEVAQAASSQAAGLLAFGSALKFFPLLLHNPFSSCIPTLGRT